MAFTWITQVAAIFRHEDLDSFYPTESMQWLLLGGGRYAVFSTSMIIVG